MKTPSPAKSSTPSIRFIIIALSVLLVIGIAIFLAFALSPSSKKSTERFYELPNAQNVKDQIPGTWSGSCEFQNIRIGANDTILTAKCGKPGEKKSTRMIDISKCANNQVDYSAGELMCWQKK